MLFKTLFCSVMKNPARTTFDGEDADEQILYLFRKSFITNFDWIFIAILLFFVPFIANAVLISLNVQIDESVISPQFLLILNAFWYLFLFAYIFNNFINWFFNVYIVTNKKIIDMDFIGILYKNISEAPLASVEDITSNVSGALRVTFNYGSVYIQTAGERREFEFTDVSNPARIRDLIADIVANLKKKQHV